MRSGANDGGSGDEDFPGAGQAASGGENNMCVRPFGEHRSTSEGAASSVGGGGDMDQSSAGNTSTRWSNSSRYGTLTLAQAPLPVLNVSMMFCAHLISDDLKAE